MKRMKLEKKNILKATVSVIVAIAFALPGASSVANDEIAISGIDEGTFGGTIIYIDDSNTAGPWNGTIDYPYQYIQDGINAAIDGDTIIVNDGIYNENILVNKELTIKVASSPVIDGQGMFGPAINIQADNVILQGFIIKNFTATPTAYIGAILVEGNNTTINSSTIENITSAEANPAGIGIDVHAKDVQITNNTVHDVGSIGIRVRHDWDTPPTESNNVLIENNTVYRTNNTGVLVTGYAKGITIRNNVVYDSLMPTPYNLFVHYGAENVTIEDNYIHDTYSNVVLGGCNNITISNNTIADTIADPSPGKNIYILNDYANWTGDVNLLSTNVDIINNNIMNGSYGIRIINAGATDPSQMASTTTINYNNIYDDTDYGVENMIGTNVNAEYNWWGNTSGPYHPTTNPNGLGDNVSDNVEFVPWIGYYSWDVTIDVAKQDEIIGDTIIFGEKPDAFDTQDSYDAPKPDIPPLPYVYAWFDAGLPEPYDRLWEDYRDYPDDSEIWDLYITCNTTTLASVNLVVSWNTIDTDAAEYDHIRLYDASDVLLADMKAVESYVFPAEFEYLYHFQVRCSMNNAPIAYDDFYTTGEDVPLTVPPPGVLGNDEDVENTLLIALLESDVSNGTLTLNADGSFEYTPSIGFSGDDSFTYKANDGMDNSTPATVTITVLKCHLAPLQQYWNLMSLPVSEPVDKTQIVIRSGGTDYTWSEAVSGQIILDNLYEWNTTTQCYAVESSTFNPGRAYWMWAYQNCELLVYSNDVGTGDITTFQLKWNLVGFPYDISLVKENLIVNYEGVNYTWDEATTNANPTGSPIVLKFLYGWERTSQRYAYADSFDAGEGYWMYAYKACTLTNPLV